MIFIWIDVFLFYAPSCTTNLLYCQIEVSLLSFANQTWRQVWLFNENFHQWFLLPFLLWNKKVQQGEGKEKNLPFNASLGKRRYVAYPLETPFSVRNVAEDGGWKFVGSSTQNIPLMPWWVLDISSRTRHQRVVVALDFFLLQLPSQSPAPLLGCLFSCHCC